MWTLPNTWLRTRHFPLDSLSPNFIAYFKNDSGFYQNLQSKNLLVTQTPCPTYIWIVPDIINIPDKVGCESALSFQVHDPNNRQSDKMRPCKHPFTLSAVA